MAQVAPPRDDRHAALEEVLARHLPSGGFANRPGEAARADATAWAVLVLLAEGADRTVIEAGRAHLGLDQLPDGRVPVSREHPEALWPTSLAVLAWLGECRYRPHQQRALEFLLKNESRHWKKTPYDPIGHNTDLKGWGWIEDTHGWIEPTAMTLLALSRSGYGDHARVQEALRLVLDRQLPKGGWNYGNTTVFGRELNPAPESTGAALLALAGRVPRSVVHHSLDYLSTAVEGLRTPIALGWSLLGLRAWDASPSEAAGLFSHCLARQGRYGTYDTCALSLLLLSQSETLLPGQGEVGEERSASMKFSSNRVQGWARSITPPTED